LANNNYLEYGEIMPITTMPNDELLSISDAAALSGHSVATYRWYRANGIGPKSWKCGRYVRYWRSDVVAWIADQESATARGGLLDGKPGISLAT
jgi:predicted DNA-binding transcriptional regulator AlpA